MKRKVFSKQSEGYNLLIHKLPILGAPEQWKALCKQCSGSGHQALDLISSRTSWVLSLTFINNLRYGFPCLICTTQMFSMALQRDSM